jgi:hypothetical protein
MILRLWAGIGFGVVAGIALAGTVNASPLMVVTCSGEKGINLAATTEKDRPKELGSEVFDSAAGAYVSHPKDTHGSIITVNQDGTATQTSFLNDGKSTVNELRLVGKINDTAISFIEAGDDTGVSLFTLYPKESLMVSVATAYLGWRKSIPIGAVYISRCEFSKVLP